MFDQYLTTNHFHPTRNSQQKQFIFKKTAKISLIYLNEITIPILTMSIVDVIRRINLVLKH